MLVLLVVRAQVTAFCSLPGFCAGSTLQNGERKHTTKNFARFPHHFHLNYVFIIQQTTL